MIAYRDEDHTRYQGMVIEALNAFYYDIAVKGRCSLGPATKFFIVVKENPSTVFCPFTSEESITDVMSDLGYSLEEITHYEI